jgi:hypothetical protein
MTAQLDGIESAQPTAPTPRAMYALPNGMSYSSVRVFVTDFGLLVYDQKPDAAEPVTDGALFFSPMDWKATLAGQPSLPQPRVAFALETEAGTVRVSPQLGCGCHLRALKSWVPSWTSRSMPWGATA